MSVSTITTFHNPACGTSRNVLALIPNSGVEPVVVDYLKTPPGRTKLVELIAAMGVSVRSVPRQKGTPYDELKLDDPSWTDDQLIDFIVAHPNLMNRPIVVTPLGTRLCRPSEAVLDILPSPQLAPFSKEDGEPVIDANLDRTGHRVDPWSWIAGSCSTPRVSRRIARSPSRATLAEPPRLRHQRHL